MPANPKNSLVDNYLTTAPIGQVSNVMNSKIAWMKTNFVPHFPALDSNCLEVGPGQGELLLLWKELGYKRISSIDISKDVCRHVKKIGFDCKLVKDSSAFLKKHPNEYDLIVLNDVLEHIPKHLIVDLVKSIYDSLRPKGKLIVKVPNAQSPHFAVGRYGDLTHEQSFTETSFTQLFRVCGYDNYYFLAEKQKFRFSVKSILANYVVKPLYFFWIRKIRESTGHASPRILTQAIIAVAEKQN